MLPWPSLTICLVRVAVMHVGIVCVGVDQWQVTVRVGVRFATIPRGIVGMPVVLIVRMGMRVYLQLVRVQVSVMLGEVQPYPCGHQQASDD